MDWLQFMSHTQANNLTMANEKKFKKGPRTSDIGCTQASVSERSIEEDANIPMAASALMSPLPLARAMSTMSTGDTCRALRTDGVIETAAVGTARTACIGANAMHDGETASTATIDSNVFIIAKREER